MFDINKKDYILKLSNGKSVNIFHKDNVGILLSVLSKRNQWTDPVVLFKGAQPNFSVCMDDFSNIHLLCQDIQGTIFYMHSDNNDWDTETLIKSKTPSSNDKHLKVLHCQGTIIFLFVIEYSGKKILSFQTKRDDVLAPPKVIDYVSDSKKLYHVLPCPNNSLRIVYRLTGNKNNKIVYRNFIKSKNEWDDFTHIATLDIDNQLLSTGSDDNGFIHTLWQKTINKNYKLIYGRYHPLSKDLNVEKALFSAEYSFIDSSIILFEEQAIVYWIKNNDIFYCFSEDGGDNWSEAAVYQLYGSKSLYCIVYISAMENELISFYINELPGNYSGGYKIAFTNDFIFKQRTVRNEEFRFKLSGILDLLSKGLEETQKNIADLKSKILDLDSKRSKTETEIDKLNIKIHMVDTDLSKIKNDIEIIKKSSEHLPQEESIP